jgi:hypothetical protein
MNNMKQGAAKYISGYIPVFAALWIYKKLTSSL